MPNFWAHNPDGLTMLEVEEALAIVLDRTRPRTPVETALTPRALGRVLAESVTSELDSPPFAKSVMDGYAVRSADATSSVALTVIEEVAAGKTPTKTIGPGQATRVMTGAPIPFGADAVIPHEQTELTENTVQLRRPVAAGEFVIPRGREMAAGEVVLNKGTVLTPAVLGLLSAVGRTTVIAQPVPRLAVVPTGDELVEPPAAPGPGQIRNSNGPMLMAQATRAGAEARYMGIARDDRDALRNLLDDALAASDIVVLSGGVSAGKYDYVPDVLRELGVEAHFHKIRMKPGKPLFFGTRGETLVFGLPGNPLSSFVGFELFVRPALRKMSGYAIPGPVFVGLPLAAPLEASNDRPTYAPGRLEVSSEGQRVRGAAWFGSADLRGLAGADALIRLPAGSVKYASGYIVSTLPVN
ncbi:MAG TPA: gephyrin-like molybdotransferase Glp [Gemmataceae bacterium]|nr:gephyrin-like molybdotransferase Glp [Gemmataceae bacterium]